jgi:dTDP-4-amino-4,6-dideoxygalactose transaminase
VTTGVETLAFEREFAAAFSAEYAVATSSCTAALELALRSLGLPQGSLVLTSAVTFSGAVHAIVHAGLQPVLVDVDSVTGMPTEETIERAARECCGPSAMVVTHLAGDPLDVAQLAGAAGLPLDRIVQDAAHALGSTKFDVPVAGGPAACFSFYATKNLPMGEGGMFTTEDGDRADWVSRGRLHGMSRDAWRRYLPGGGWRYDVEFAGLKANMTDLQAAIGRAQLTHFGEWQSQRSLIAATYDELLGGVPGIRLPHRPEGRGDSHAWHLYAVGVEPQAGISRDDLIDQLASKGIGTSVHFLPIHQLSHFRAVIELPLHGLPGADRFAAETLSLPIYPRLRVADLHRVSEAVRSAVRHSQKVGIR